MAFEETKTRIGDNFRNVDLYTQNSWPTLNYPSSRWSVSLHSKTRVKGIPRRRSTRVLKSKNITTDSYIRWAMWAPV